MSIPFWVLLGFAGWTLVTLLGTIGVCRWRKILTGRAELMDFPADVPHGSAWYRRAMRAHANCVENLPLYTAVVVAMLAAGASHAALDGLALVVIGGRVGQTLVHVGLPETNVTVAVRFALLLGADRLYGGDGCDRRARHLVACAPLLNAREAGPLGPASRYEMAPRAGLEPAT